MKRTFLYLTLLLFPFVGACGHQGRKADNRRSDAARVRELSDEAFVRTIYDFRSNPDNWKYAGDRPAIVDFYATWCAPCRAVAPIIDELAETYDGRIAVYKVDVDRAREAARALGISSIPAVLFIPVEGQPQMVVGARPKATYREQAEKLLQTQ